MNCLPDLIPMQDDSLSPCNTFQKDRWKPSELELTALKLYFDKNPLPNREEKHSIILLLQHQYNSKIEKDQLDRWFQNRRKRTSNQCVKTLIRSRYKRLDEDQLTELNFSFAKNNYPKQDEMATIADHLHVSASKIENWYKYNRRSLAKQGFFNIKSKKYFKDNELSLLLEAFEGNSHPSKGKTVEIAETLGCHELQIKNWFSNRRKKEKLLHTKTQPKTEEDKLEDSKSDPSPIPFDLEDKTFTPNQESESTQEIFQAETPEILSSLPEVVSFPKPHDQNTQPIYHQRDSLPLMFSQPGLSQNVNGLYYGNKIETNRLEWFNNGAQINQYSNNFPGHNNICFVHPVNPIVIMSHDLRVVNPTHQVYSVLRPNDQMNSIPITLIPMKQNQGQYSETQRLFPVGNNSFASFSSFMPGLSYNIPL